MAFQASRRRLLAGLAFFGATGLLPSATRAEETTTDVVPCSTGSNSGTFSNPANNYTVTATGAQFAFVAQIKASGENIVLFADDAHGGLQTQGLALAKGSLVRDVTTNALTASSIAFETPLTAYGKDGQYYGIVQLSHDQGVPIGLAMYLDGTEFGEWELKKGEFDPTSRDVSFTGDAAQKIYENLMRGGAFRADLVAGGTVYSQLTVETGAFAEFVNSTLLPSMQSMAEADLASPCHYDPNAINYDGGCFLTTACCAVVGLNDDCFELRSLRQFRDGWMSQFAEGRAQIARYYDEAPAVAEALAATREGRARLLQLYWKVIVPAVLFSRLGANRAAYVLYRRMMVDLLGVPNARVAAGSK